MVFGVFSFSAIRQNRYIFREQYKYSGEGNEIVHAGYSQEPNPEYEWSWEIFMDFLDLAGRSTEGSKL